MTKEELLDQFKKEILYLRDHKEKFSDKEFLKERIIKNTEINNACKNLNSCDALWVSEEYEKWFKNNIA